VFAILFACANGGVEPRGTNNPTAALRPASNPSDGEDPASIHGRPLH
jgi:hypothetical protein